MARLHREEKMDRYDYINSIIDFLQGRTGMNFQKAIGIVLKEYNTYKKKTYEMPDAYGGDQKNDGWVVEDALFYQIYAPARDKKSLKHDMQDKFSEDLGGLLERVYKKGLWGGEVKEFVFLVNTFDNHLPEDSERYFDKEVARLKEEYNIDFKHKVVNVSYIFDILSEIADVNVLDKIDGRLKVNSMVNYNAVSEEAMTDLILKISANLGSKLLDKLMNKNGSKDYNRVSSVKKISINKLDDCRDEIETIISNLDVVENAVKSINQDLLFENKFERVKEFIVSKYDDLSKDLSGVELYRKLIEEVVECAEYVDNETSAEFLVVYIFDKCDIFEKE